MSHIKIIIIINSQVFLFSVYRRRIFDGVLPDSGVHNPTFVVSIHEQTRTNTFKLDNNCRASTKKIGALGLSPSLAREDTPYSGGKELNS